MLIISEIYPIDNGAGATILFNYLEQAASKDDIKLVILDKRKPKKLDDTLKVDIDILSFVEFLRNLKKYKYEEVVIFGEVPFFLYLFLKYNKSNIYTWHGDTRPEILVANYIEDKRFSELNARKRFYYLRKLPIALIRKIIISMLSNMNVYCSNFSLEFYKSWPFKKAFITFPYIPKSYKIDTSGKRKIRRLLFFGGNSGSGSRSGLRYLTNEIIPIIQLDDSTRNIEILITGREPIPSTISDNLKNYKNVKIISYVENIDQLIHDSEILFFPIPIQVGNRTRVLHGQKNKALIIGHSSLAKGNPFLVNGENCLLGSTPDEILFQIKYSLNESNKAKLKQISENGYVTWKENYHTTVQIDNFKEIGLDS